MENYKPLKDFIKSGSISSVCISLFYPLEIIKLRLQTNQSLKVPFKNYYRGISKSLLFVFPEKGIKFTTFNYCQNNNFKYSTTILTTTFLQSLISNPIEYYRLNKQFNNLKLINKNMYRGYQFIVFRDVIFNYLFFNLSYQKTDFKDNLLGGLIATSIATPFDVIKNQYQKNIPFNVIYKDIKIKPSILIKGIIPRTLSVGGFYGLTYFIYQNLN